MLRRDVSSQQESDANVSISAWRDAVLHVDGADLCGEQAAVDIDQSGVRTWNISPAAGLPIP